MASHRHVTLVNRSSKVLNGMWDGRPYALEPGRHSYPSYMAEKFKLQNPIMGSEDPRTGNIQYLIGIVEEGDPIDPVEQNLQAIEKWDRSLMGPAAQNVEIVPGATGLFSGRDVHAQLPASNAFVDPRS